MLVLYAASKRVSEPIPATCESDKFRAAEASKRSMAILSGGRGLSLPNATRLSKVIHISQHGQLWLSDDFAYESIGIQTPLLEFRGALEGGIDLSHQYFLTLVEG